MLFANLFLHVKILRIASQAAQSSVKTSPKTPKAVENPTYARVRPKMWESVMKMFKAQPLSWQNRNPLKEPISFWVPPNPQIPLLLYSDVERSNIATNIEKWEQIWRSLNFEEFFISLSVTTQFRYWILARGSNVLSYFVGNTINKMSSLTNVWN